MAVYRDFDYDLRINGTLTVSGNTTIPSSNLTVGGTISGNMIKGDGSQLTNLPIPVATSTPSDGSTSPISSDWAFDHISKTGVNGGHLPSAGTTTQYLRGDGSWATPPNTNYYVSSVSSTDGGKGTMTLNRSGLGALTINLSHDHNDIYYTETEINTLLNGKADSSHTHNYDNYQYWTLNGSNISSAESVTIQGSGATTVSMSGNVLTINSTDTDTNTWRPIDTTPALGNTANSISSDWASQHKDSTGVGGHIPTGGTTSKYLRGDGTWQTPPNTNNYVTSISGNGNGIFYLNRNGLSQLTLDLSHNHDDRYYTETEVNTLLSGKADSSHTHPYDNYQSWKIQVGGGTTEDIGSGEAVNFVGSGATSISRNGNTITISSTDTDTNTHRPIHDSPVDGATTTSISSNWAFDHTSTTGIGSHVPTGGTTSTFLRGDGVWATVSTTDTNNYLTSVTGNGNGTVTFKRSGLGDLTWNASHTHSEYLSNGDNQTVGNSFSVKGSMFVGINSTYGNVAGSIYIRNSSGNNVIQIVGDGTTKSSTVKAYINNNGDATFDGTLSGHTLKVTNRNEVTNLNAEMVGGTSGKDVGVKQTAYELGGSGVHSGLAVVQEGDGQQTQIRINSGVAYTSTGKRIDWSGGGYTLSAPSSTTNSHRYDSVYIAGPSEGNNEGKINHVQGTYSGTPTAPSIPSDGILLAHVYMGSNQGTITNDKITDKRDWKPFSFISDKIEIRKPIYINDGLTSWSSTVSVLKPMRNNKTNMSIIFSAGQTVRTWNHDNNAGTNYIVRLSCNSPEPHVYWSGKYNNSITINLDDVCETDVTVDVSIEYY
jgi:hypothetical protein